MVSHPRTMRGCLWPRRWWDEGTNAEWGPSEEPSRMGRTRAASSLVPPRGNVGVENGPKVKPGDSWELSQGPLAPAPSVRCFLICVSSPTCISSHDESQFILRGKQLSCSPVTGVLSMNRMLQGLLTPPLLLWRRLLHWHHTGLWWSRAVSWRIWWSFLSKLWVGCVACWGRRDACILMITC